MKAKKLSIISLFILFILCFSSFTLKVHASITYNFDEVDLITKKASIYGWDNLNPKLWGEGGEVEYIYETSYNGMDGGLFRSAFRGIAIYTRYNDYDNSPYDRKYELYNRTNTWIQSTPIWNVFNPNIINQEFTISFYSSHNVFTDNWTLDLSSNRYIQYDINTTIWIYDGDTGENLINYTNLNPCTWVLGANNITGGASPRNSIQNYASQWQQINIGTAINDRLRYVVYIGSIAKVSGNFTGNSANIGATAMIHTGIDDIYISNDFKEGSKSNLYKDIKPEEDITNLNNLYPFEWDNPLTAPVIYTPSWCGFDANNNFSIYFNPNIYRGEEISLSGITYNTNPYSVMFLHYFNKNVTGQDFRSSIKAYPTINLTFTNPQDNSDLKVRFYSRVYYMSGSFSNANMYKNINITVRFLTTDGVLIDEVQARNLRFFETNKTLDDSTFIMSTATLEDSGYNSINVEIRINSSIYLDVGLGAGTMNINYRTFIDTVSSNWKSGYWNPLTDQPYPNLDPYEIITTTTITYTDTVEDYIRNSIIAPLGLGEIAGGLFFTLVIMFVIVIFGYYFDAPPIMYIIGGYICLFLCYYINLVPTIVMIMVMFATVLLMGSWFVSLWYRR